MKRLALFVVTVSAVLAVVRSWRMRRADAELWQEATAERDLG
jgi:hypothetical protein